MLAHDRNAVRPHQRHRLKVHRLREIQPRQIGREAAAAPPSLIQDAAQVRIVKPLHLVRIPAD